MAAKLQVMTLLGFAVVATGCGTINNMIVGTPPAVGTCEPTLEVYGGVRSDFRDARAVLLPLDEKSSAGPVARIGAAAGLMLDVPLSAIADTLTLGKTIPAAMQRQDEAP